MMYFAKTFGLFVVTAVAEILGCYLPYLWMKMVPDALIYRQRPSFPRRSGWTRSEVTEAAGATSSTARRRARR